MYAWELFQRRRDMSTVDENPQNSDPESRQTPSLLDATFQQEALPCLDAVHRFAGVLVTDETGTGDLVEQTFASAYRDWHTWRVGTDPCRWLFSICYSVFLQIGRREAWTGILEQRDDDALAAVIDHSRSVDDGTDELLAKLNFEQILRGTLKELDETDRKIVLLVDGEKYSYGDAADLLSIPVETVRAHLYHARRLLQEALFAHARDSAEGSDGNNT